MSNHITSGFMIDNFIHDNFKFTSSIDINTKLTTALLFTCDMRFWFNISSSSLVEAGWKSMFIVREASYEPIKVSSIFWTSSWCRFWELVIFSSIPASQFSRISSIALGLQFVIAFTRKTIKSIENCYRNMEFIHQHWMNCKSLRWEMIDLLTSITPK